MSKDLDLSSYDFTLPNDLIATEPIKPKENAKLLIYHNGKITHTTFYELFNYIPKDYLIVLNDTRVINARLFANKLSLESLHKTQILNDSILPTKREIFYHKHLSNNLHLVQIKGKAKLHDIFTLQYNNTNVFIQVVDIKDDGYKIVSFFTLKDISALKQNLLQNHAEKLSQEKVLSLLQTCGNIPLPPYMKRESTEKDSKDYQSIFARNEGSVAAPTASLHFSESMFKYLKENYNHAFVTLHVGAGTFKPITCENILNHKIHTESCIIAKKEAQKILESKKILCVGTTAMRSVEWLIRENVAQIESDIMGENAIFLNPFNPPKKVKALLTNFHLPKSSLLMLVSSIIGRKETLRIYEEAIANKYRFYSYGDGMLII
ncbi:MULTISPECIES: tRNA preQ1(34) S-adenosylmethionine ribosyltransferase-isomerase QueA [Helicobacter]|uniref:S-adenosylmethionine:tRNA ribosyltransferase-isomerase n=1 Tax=Helicobacter bilis ATCC 43879 TaxID=613026 RepID=C3XHI1_9HELI|nr:MULTISPECIES: tRNA preQ1(34) S-adenosylmethionine ribosyltransferase-isomerase QueA [Helicobacter]EEO24470.1 S-adenosylmethionine:tRNA ribosyltransferase-isomerase [Helicobacter bilis ATCC 43879]